MTKEEMQKLHMTISVFFPNYHPENKTQIIESWMEMLSDYSYHDIFNALKTYVAIDHTGFAPTIGQLLLCLSIAEEDLGELEAWSMVRKAIQNGIYNSVAEYAKLPPVIQKAIGTADNIREMAMMDTDALESVEQSQFVKNYRVQLQRDKQIRNLPPKLQDAIGISLKEVPFLTEKEKEELPDQEPASTGNYDYESKIEELKRKWNS